MVCSGNSLEEILSLRNLQICSHLFLNNDTRTQNMIKADTKYSKTNRKCGPPGTVQRQSHLGTCEKCKVSVPMPDPLSQNLV